MSTVPEPPSPEARAAFFETFGYVHAPGVLADDIGWITEEFRAVLRESGGGPPEAGSPRDLPYAVIDGRERLCQLLDHPAIEDLVTNLLGADANYLGSTGGYFVGDTAWHRDSTKPDVLRAKLYCNLTSVDETSGALSVVPRSHARGDLFEIGEPDANAVALPATPGDVIVFDQSILHGAFGGPADRVAFTMTFGRRCRTPAELAELRQHIAGFAEFGVNRLYGDLLRSTATPARLRHLEQPLAVEGALRGPRAAVARYRFRRLVRRARQSSGAAR